MALSYNTIFGRALHFPGAVSTPEEIITLAESQEWAEKSNIGKIEKCSLTITDSSIIGEITSLINAYAEAVEATAPMTDEDLEKTESLDIEVSKYTVGAEFGNHADTNTSEEETPGVVSVVLVLNDGGGEFGFADIDGEVSLAAGDAIVFPSYLERYTTLVEDSVKYYATINVTLDV